MEQIINEKIEQYHKAIERLSKNRQTYMKELDKVDTQIVQLQGAVAALQHVQQTFKERQNKIAGEIKPQSEELPTKEVEQDLDTTINEPIIVEGVVK